MRYVELKLVANVTDGYSDSKQAPATYPLDVSM